MYRGQGRKSCEYSNQILFFSNYTSPEGETNEKYEICGEKGENLWKTSQPIESYYSRNRVAFHWLTQNRQTEVLAV